MHDKHDHAAPAGRHLLSSRLYCRYRNFTGSALLRAAFADYTAGGELHPAPKIRCSIGNMIALFFHFVKDIPRNLCYDILELDQDGRS